MNKLRIAVLTGGPFAEHESSILSGEAVRRALAKTEYEITPILVKRDGEWSTDLPKIREIADLVFVAMHGKYGEDGTVQDILGQEHLPYTGSDALPSALAINKVLSRELFRAIGLNTPRYAVIEKLYPKELDIDFDFPVVIKPIDRGLSFGAGVVREQREFDEAIEKTFDFSNSVLVEEYIPGREITCSVLDDGGDELIPMPPVEIIPKSSSFLDYRSKHTGGGADNIVPARLPVEERELVQEIASLTHRIIGASGMSKSDLILGEDGQFYVLEINTIPRFTETSCFIQGVLGHGLSLTEVCERIIEAALRKQDIRH